MTLPDTKNVPGHAPLNKKTLLYGPQKIGKSTLVSKLYPNVVYFGTDPTGLEELEVFKIDVRDWSTFRRAAQELAAYLIQCENDGAEPMYDAICVDTVDELARFARLDVLAGLSGGPVRKGPDDFLHETDWEFGKAWNAVTEEFRIRVAKLCALGLPVVFISHSKVATKKNRVGQEITVHAPDVGSGQLREWLLKFVDYIFFAEMLQTAEGEHRILHTMPSETFLAGARQPEGKPLLPEPLPLDGARLRAALLATASAPGAQDVTTRSTAKDNQTTVDVNLAKGTAEIEANGVKAEPKYVQAARKIVAGIDRAQADRAGFNAKEAKALQDIAKYEAKQREKTSAAS